MPPWTRRLVIQSVRHTLTIPEPSALVVILIPTLKAVFLAMTRFESGTKNESPISIARRQSASPVLEPG